MFPSFYYWFRKIYSKFMLFLIFNSKFYSCLAIFLILPILYLKRVLKSLIGIFSLNSLQVLVSSGGGLANAMLGSVIMVGMASLIGIPWGCFLGICLSEYHFHPLSKFLRFVIDLSISTPSIVIGNLCLQPYRGFF